MHPQESTSELTFTPSPRRPSSSRARYQTLASSVLTPLGLLPTLLLPQLKITTTEHYTALRSTLLDPATPISAYLLRAEQSLQSEEDRLVEVFGLAKESGGVVKVVETVLIADAKGTIIQRGVAEGMVGGGLAVLSMELDEEVDDGTIKGKGKEVAKPKKDSTPDEDGLTRLMRLLRRVGSDAGVKPVWGEWVRVSQCLSFDQPSAWPNLKCLLLVHRLTWKS